MTKRKSLLAKLLEPPTGSVGPPTVTKVQELRFSELTWQDFEKLCLRLARLQTEVEICRIYGSRGQNQQGIDIYLKPKSSARYWVFQCKREEDYGPEKIRRAVTKFLTGNWANRSERFYLCTKDSLQPTDRQEAIEEQRTILAKIGVSLVVWDAEQISHLLKTQHDIVEDFFGAAWVKSFCINVPQQVVIDDTAALLVVQLLREALRPAASLQGVLRAKPTAEGSANLSDGPSPTQNTVETILGSPFPTTIGALRAVTTQRSAAPPPLPKPHISRAQAFSEFARELSRRGIVSVIGYAKSGKTCLLAEYALSYPGTCTWINVDRSTPTSDEWWDFAMLSLATHFALTESSTTVVRDRLLDESTRQRILIVVDDVHLLSDLNALGRFEKLVAASNGRIELVLAGIDEPAFVDRIRSRGITTWRAPGFALQECLQMFLQGGEHLTPPQKTGLEALRGKTDGHPGIVSLCREAIGRIRTATDAKAFEKGLDQGLGAGPDAFSAALFRTFRLGLTDQQLELCRRVAIALNGFSRRFAELLWQNAGSIAEFADTWDSCLLRAFDPTGTARQQLPVLYRSGLLQRSTAEEKQAWHSIAAEVLGEPIDGGVDIIDASDAIEHLLRSGNVHDAVDKASGFLLIAGGRRHRSVSRFLLTRFKRLFTTADIAVIAPWPTRVRWHASVVATYRELGELDLAKSASRELYEVLIEKENDPQSTSGQLGWSILLMQAAWTGHIEWAKQAAIQLKKKGTDGLVDPNIGLRRFGVLLAYLASDANPVDGLRFLLSDLDGGGHGMWQEPDAFGFWRDLGIGISRFHEANPELSLAVSTCATLWELAKATDQAGETNIAIMLLGTCSLIQIDRLRDFPAAVASAESMRALKGERTDRVAAFGAHALGNSLRCLGTPLPAVDAYRKALGHWPDVCHAERAETAFMLAVCLGRLHAYDEAYDQLSGAAKLYQLPGRNSGVLTSARANLEAANIAIRNSRHTKALRSLIRAHDLLSENHRRSPEWVVVAQLAVLLCSRVETNELAELPIPGFTIGLRHDEVTGQMEPTAPTLMLGQACAASGSPHRAIRLFDDVDGKVDKPLPRRAVAAFGLNAALSIQDLSAATKFCEMFVLTYERLQSSSLAVDDVAVTSYQISRVVSLASALTAAPGGRETLGSAEKRLLPIVNIGSPIALLRASFQGMLKSLQDGDDTGLEAAIKLAFANQALNVAKELAWFWCFRRASEHPARQAELVKWQWRLTWLSIEVGKSAPTFLAGLLQQVQRWWDQLAKSSSENLFAARVRDSLRSAQTPLDALTDARKELSLLLVTDAGVGSLCLALSEVLRGTDDWRWVDDLREPVVLGIAELILSPISHEVQETIDADIRLLEDAMRRRTIEETDKSIWQREVAGLRTLLSFVQANHPATNTTTTLLRIAPLVPQFRLEASAANYYVWLKHTLNSEPFSISRLHEVDAVLGCQHAKSLAGSPSLPSYLRYRVALVHYEVAARNASADLSDAIALLMIQRGEGIVVSRLAVDSARSQYNASYENAIAAISQLSKLIEEFRSEASFDADLAMGLFELGQQRRMIGSVLANFSDAKANSTEWLRAAKTDLEECLLITANFTRSDQMMIRLTEQRFVNT